MPSILPRFHKSRINVLIINEFNADMTMEGVAIEFKKVHDRIEIGKRKSLTEGRKEGFSLWNFYLEKEGLDEYVDKVGKKHHDARVPVKICNTSSNSLIRK
jgi:hypothetical protein